MRFTSLRRVSPRRAVIQSKPAGWRSAVLPGKASTATGQPPGAAQQAVDDLGAVVAGVAAGGELAAGALEVAGGDVVQGEGAGGEVAFRELALDGGLAQGEPVHGVVEVVGGGVAEVEQGGEGGAAGGAEFALDAQLGAGAEPSWPAGSWLARARRSRSMRCWGRAERLARVRFLTLPFSQ